MKLITAIFNLFCLMTFGAQIPLLIDQDTRAPLGASNPPAWKVWLNLNTANLGTAAYSNATAFVLANDSRLTDARAPLAHTQNYTTIMSAPWLTVEADPIWSGVSNTVVYTNDVRLTDSRAPLAHNQAWNTVTNTPTTVSGYGITDANVHNSVTLGTTNGLSLSNQQISLALGTSGTVPAAGNDARFTDARIPLAHDQPASTITNLGTAALSGSNDFAPSSFPAQATNSFAPIAGAHAAVTLGTTNGLSLSGQALSLTLGTTATLPAAGNDARLTDARAPLAHNQSASTITNLGTAALSGSNDFAPSSFPAQATNSFAPIAGAHAAVTLGTTNGLSLSGQALSLTLGTTATLPAAGNDARFSDARAPTAHNQPASTVTNLGTAAMSGSNDFALATHNQAGGSITSSVPLSSAVSGTLTNSITGNAATATMASNAVVAAGYISKGTGTGVVASTVYESGSKYVFPYPWTSGNTNVFGITFYPEDPVLIGFTMSAGTWAAPNYRQLVMSDNAGVIINGGSVGGLAGVTISKDSGTTLVGGTLTVSNTVSAPSFIQSGYGVLDTRHTNGFGETNTAAGNHTHGLSTNIIVILGDSISAAISVTNTWPEYVTNQSAIFSGGRVYNYAHMGWSTYDVQTDYPNTAHLVRPQATNEHGYAFVWCGVNDMYQPLDPHVVYGNLSNIWRTARADGYKVIAINPTAGSSMTPSVLAGHLVLNGLIASNRSLYDYLARPDVMFPVQTDTNYWRTDGVHPTPLGAQVIATMIARTVDGYNPVQAELTTGTTNTFDAFIAPSGGSAVAYSFRTPTNVLMNDVYYPTSFVAKASSMDGIFRDVTPAQARRGLDLTNLFVHFGMLSTGIGGNTVPLRNNAGALGASVYYSSSNATTGLPISSASVKLFNPATEGASFDATSNQFSAFLGLGSAAYLTASTAAGALSVVQRTTNGSIVFPYPWTSGNTNVFGITFYPEDPVLIGFTMSAGTWAAPNYRQLVMSDNAGVIINGGSVGGLAGVTISKDSGTTLVGGTLTVSNTVSAPSFIQSGYGVLDSRLTNGLLTAIKIFVDKNGVTNTVTIQNGLISAWTP